MTFRRPIGVIHVHFRLVPLGVIGKDNFAADRALGGVDDVLGAVPTLIVSVRAGGFLFSGLSGAILLYWHRGSNGHRTNRTIDPLEFSCRFPRPTSPRAKPLLTGEAKETKRENDQDPFHDLSLERYGKEPGDKRATGDAAAALPAAMRGLPTTSDSTAELPLVNGGGSGAEGNRTLDLLNAIQALSQLSYGPTTEEMER